MAHSGEIAESDHNGVQYVEFACAAQRYKCNFIWQSVRPIAPSISLIRCYLPNPVLSLCDSVSVTQIDRTFSPPLHPSHNDLSNAIDA
jgi:hypothetical protein